MYDDDEEEVVEEPEEELEEEEEVIEEEFVEDPRLRKRREPLEPLLIPRFSKEERERPEHIQRPLRTIFCIILLLLFISTILTEVLMTYLLSESDWTYWNQDQWCTFSKDCCVGTRQSPINIANVVQTNESRPLNFVDYGTGDQEITLTNDGRTIVLTVKSGSSGPPLLSAPWLIPSEKKKFDFHFQAAHFHWGSTRSKGSEHRLDGEKFEFELHLLHYGDEFKSFEAASESKLQSAICVVALVGNVKASNVDETMKLQALTTNLFNVKYKGQTVTLKDKDFTLKDLLPPAGSGFYVYNGSLSYPFCKENVVWVVFFVTWSRYNQLHLFRNMKSHCIGCPFKSMNNNYRQLQAVNGREIKYYMREGNATSS